MSKKLYVGNLSYTVDSQQLTELFSKCGTVDSANVIMDRDTGRSKGFAFIEMSADSAATTAIETLNGSEFNGRALNVTEARPQAPRDNNSRRY
jgi:RNA recognition motif-containing protein